MENYGKEYLKKKLDSKRSRVRLRYRYYEMKNTAEYFGSIIPTEFHWMNSMLGWCAKAVDSISDRLSFREFANDNFRLNEIYQMNNPDVLFPSAILGALISSCDFIYISPDDDGFPRMQVIDGGNATGVMDPVTGLMTEGYAVLEREGNKPDGEVVRDAYFTIDGTYYWGKDGKDSFIKNPAPFALLVPIVNRPDAVRAFGHSVISRACMKQVQSALRTLLRAEVTAEFYSFPQKYVLGLSEDAEPMDKWQATISSFLQFDKDADGDHPQLGQFQQQSATPHMEQLRMCASLFAGETGLTLDDLGFPSDNPSSAEAIAASHETMRLKCRSAQRTFGSGFLNAGYLAACVRDNMAYERRLFYVSKAKWNPIFEPDFSALSAVGDGLQKLIGAAPGYFGTDTLQDLLGIEASEDPFEVGEING